MFSAANDTIPLFRPRRGRDDRDAGKKKLRVDGAADRPDDAVWAQGRMQGGGAATHPLTAQERAMRGRGTHAGGQCANRKHRPCLRKIKTLKRSTQEWQDLRAVHDLRGTRSEKGPFLARSSRGVFPDDCLQDFSDARRAYLAKASSFWMHGGDMLPRTGAFPVRGPFGNA